MRDRLRGRRNVKRRADLLPLINPPPLARFAGMSNCTSHLGGMLLACAPDLLFGCERLYET
ncbi:MAG: hypothetical protein OIF47_03330 [Marinibacterium sp.]|nr:hypothetical protein [Marinibacterium sp.]